MNLKNNCLRTGAYVLIDSLVQNGVEHIFVRQEINSVHDMDLSVDVTPRNVCIKVQRGVKGWFWLWMMVTLKVTTT
jgi:hypothetical protein